MNGWPGVLLLTVCLSALAAEPRDARRNFASWRELFTAIAGRLDVEATPDNVFDLAADSDKQWQSYDGRPLILVKANLYRWSGGAMLNQLRGASDNGPFFLVEPTEKGLRLIGTMEGNGCKAAATAYRDKEAPRERFECTWHLSATSWKVSTYETDGRTVSLVDTRAVEDK